MALLEIKQLVSEFAVPRGRIRAVDDVDLTVDRGEVVCLVGESGCGKSALANSVIGLMPLGAAAHPQGQILFDGIDLTTLPEKSWQQIRGRRIGMIFQEPMTSLNPVLRVGVQVAEPLLIHKLANQAEAFKRAIHALGEVGIPEPERVAKQYPHQLSGGMRQRVMIATATIAEPDLLIADEPTTALDVTIEAQILVLLKEMQARRGMAMLLITHDFGIVARIATRVSVMYAGQVVESARTDDLFAQPAHPYTAGLLASMPRRGRRGERLPAIAGTVPAPDARPSGCRFAPRCTFADEACEQFITLEQVTGGHAAHQVRCIHHARIHQQKTGYPDV